MSTLLINDDSTSYLRKNISCLAGDVLWNRIDDVDVCRCLSVGCSVRCYQVERYLEDISKYGNANSEREYMFIYIRNTYSLSSECD